MQNIYKNKNKQTKRVKTREQLLQQFDKDEWRNFYHSKLRSTFL